MNKFKRLISTTVCLIIMLSAFSTAVFADNKITLIDISSSAVDAAKSGAAYIPRPVQPLAGDDNITLKKADSFPAEYSSVDAGIISSIKDQKESESCWAFTHLALLETWMLSQTGMPVNTYDFSEYHMVLSCSKYSDEDNLYGFDVTPFGGGNEYMSTAYLARGSGIVNEADDPFDFSQQERDIEITNSIPNFGMLNNSLFYSYSYDQRNDAVNKIKELVLDYGAVGTSLYYLPNYESLDRASFYYINDNPDDVTANHAVTIVGWDDNYSKENFAVQPQNDGAFLVKNSWGDYNDLSGYFYCSYEDALIARDFFVSEMDMEKDYDNIYQYDPLGMCSLLEVGASSYYYAMKYTANSSQEYLTSVGTYVMMPNTKLEVFVNQYDDSVEHRSSFKSVYTGTFEDTGYFKINIDPVKLYSSKFAVAIKVTSSTSSTYIPVQTYYPYYSSNSQNTPGKCYIGDSFDGFRLIENTAGTGTNTMACLKAFTSNPVNITTPGEGVTIQDNVISIVVPESTTSQQIIATGIDGAECKLYSDKECTKLIENNTVSLEDGKTQTAYLEVTYKGEKYVYTVYIGHSSQNYESNIIEVVNGTVDQQNKIVTMTTDRMNESITPLLTLSEGATATIYADKALSSDNSYRVQINQTNTYAYIKVTAENGISYSVYTLNIISTQSGSTRFKDSGSIPNWADEYVKTASENFIMIGDDANNFNPNNNVTRYETAVIAVKLLGADSSKFSSVDLTKAFSDSIVNWAKPYVQAAYALGILSGNPVDDDYVFLGANPTTRQEFAVIICGIYHAFTGYDIESNNPALSQTWSSKDFKDADTVPSWSLNYLKNAVYLGFINGSDEGDGLYINCKSNIKRSEIAVIAAQYLEKIN